MSCIDKRTVSIELVIGEKADDSVLTSCGKWAVGRTKKERISQTNKSDLRPNDAKKKYAYNMKKD